jgi:hypothetical protein
MSKHDDEIPTPKTAEEWAEVNRLKAQRRAEILANLRASREPERPVTTTPNPIPNGRPKPSSDDLRAADFHGVASRAIANRQPPVDNQPRVSPEEAHRADLATHRKTWLKGKNQQGRDRIVGMDVDDIELVCESVGRAPRLDWHVGTVCAAEAAEAFMESVRDLPRRRGNKHTLVMMGGNGLGKSLMMAWIFAEHCYGEWLKPEDIHAGSEWEARKNSLMNGHIVYIDDLGRDGSPFAQQQLGLIIERRHDAGRPTVITTNFLLSPEQREQVPPNLRAGFREGDSIAEKYGNRLYSRLVNGRTIFAWLGGVDLRQTTRR